MNSGGTDEDLDDLPFHQAVESFKKRYLAHALPAPEEIRVSPPSRSAFSGPTSIACSRSLGRAGRPNRSRVRRTCRTRARASSYGAKHLVTSR